MSIHLEDQRLDSTLKSVLRLLEEEVDGLLRCPAERKEAATQEALWRLRPHLQAALEALREVGRLRDLDDADLVRKRGFMRLLTVAERTEAASSVSESFRSNA
jgi:hypothetical protein